MYSYEEVVAQRDEYMRKYLDILHRYAEEMSRAHKTIANLENTIKFKMKPKSVLEMLNDWAAGPVGEK